MSPRAQLARDIVGAILFLSALAAVLTKGLGYW